MLNPRAERLRCLPPVMLWAWERRENLSFIDPDHIGVAALERSLELTADTVIIHPRLQPLVLPRHTQVVAVVRIEVDRRSPPTLSVRQREKVAKAVATLADISPAAIQIDFDATRSQRRFYRNLLIDLRGRLPATMPLTITAFASWCLYDTWISALPIDEAVPMVYRMGRDQRIVLAHLRNGGDFRPALSRKSIGLSLDEEFAGLGAGKRVYLFSPTQWTSAGVRDAIREVNK